MKDRRRGLPGFLVAPLIYGISSIALASVGGILGVYDPNSGLSFALLLGVIVANLPGAKTISAFYLSGPQHGAGPAVFFYLGSIVITAVYFGVLLWLFAHIGKRYKKSQRS